MKIRNLALLIVISLAFAMVSLAQDVPVATPENPKTTIKLDEFERVGDCQMSAAVDNFFIALNNDEQATGYIINYAGADDVPSEYGSKSKMSQILRSISFRKYDSSRVVFIEGGFRERQATEFFLVPDGAVPPEPTNTVPAPRIPKTTFLWTRTGILNDDADPEEFVLPEVRARVDEENRVADLQAALETDADDQSAQPDETGNEPTASANEDETEEDTRTAEEIREQRFSWANMSLGPEIARRKASSGVMVLYADDQYYDIAGLKRFVEEARDLIAATAGIQPERIRVVFGGYHESLTVEYYVVPKGGKQPEPKPEERQPDAVPESN